MKRTLLINMFDHCFLINRLNSVKAIDDNIVSIAIKECGYYKGTNKYFVTINGIIL